MRKIMVLSISAAFLFVQIGCRGDRRAKNYNQKTTLDDRGVAFVKAVSESDMLGMESSEIAKSSSKNSRVLRFAQMMLDDHAQVADDLKQLRSDHAVQLPDSLSTGKQEMLIDLQEKKSADFDNAYIDLMLKDHEDAIKLFAAEASAGKGSLKDFARKNLPRVKQHLDSVQAIKASLK